MNSKSLRIFGVAILMVLLTTGAALAQGRLLAPVKYSSEGTVTINGWDWLRAPGASATWCFVPPPLVSGAPIKAYLMIEALVTQRVNGGAGYEAQIQVVFASGGKTQTRWVTLRNPFPFEDDKDSQGVGYETFGSVMIPQTILDSFLATGTMDVTYNWGNWPPRRHVAVHEICALIAY